MSSPKSTTKSRELFERAQRLMPGGVNSPVRSFARVGDTPRFIARGQGCYIFDEDGQQYIDYMCSWGPMILGHAHPQVVADVQEALESGTSFGAATAREVELAAEIVSRVPSIEKIRLVNSGTEAVMSALRLARALTNRTKLLKFEGCYHGHADAMLVKAGSGVATLGIAGSPGVDPRVAEQTIVCRYNNLDSVRTAFRQHGDEIAAIIVEPIAGNMGVVPPAAGFLEGLREITRQYDSLLIFDEVITGFRVAGGGAQQLFDFTPDLAIFGKIIGGGLPAGAYGGPAAVMDQVAPAGPVYQAGTLSGNPLATAAGLSTLRQLTPDVYDILESRADHLQQGLQQVLAEHGVRGVVQRVGSMLTLFFDADKVSEFSDAAAASHEAFAYFFRAMLAAGVYLPPSGYEAWFVSTAHTGGIIDQTIEIAGRVLGGLTEGPIFKGLSR